MLSFATTSPAGSNLSTVLDQDFTVKGITVKNGVAAVSIASTQVS